ncbi:MAG: hypothetical protein Q9225_002109 [Loekoesia sp. 1 TL-2023]
MVAGQTHLDLPYVNIQGLDQQPQCDASCESAADIWSVLGVDTMADDVFDHGYADGAFQDPGHQNMSNMQRFLQEKETYYAGRRVYEEKHPPFNGGNHSPIALGYYGAPHPWLQSINTTHGLYPQEIWNREWVSSDHESCSVTTGNTWSPRPTESCPDYDPRYPSWPEPHVYPAECVYPGYGSGFAHGAVASSPHSITGTLSEIQQCPDTEAEDGSAKGPIHSSNSGHLDTTTHLGPGTVNFHRDEGIGSSINESTIASPISQADNTAMESVSGDGEESDYSPQNRSKRAPKKPKGRTRSHPKGSNSPTTKRSSMIKGDPHRLTSPAKISKRTSSTGKPSNAVTSPTSPHTLQASNTNDSVCQQCCKTFPSASALQRHVLSAHTRPFYCSLRRYGCTSTFGSKNEWKRHVTSQHICHGIYRCDIGTCVPRPAPPSPQSNNNDLHTTQQQTSSSDWSHNDFNRKDLFTQHLRRMHGPGSSASRPAKDNFDNGIDAIRRRCWIPLRDSPPKSICGYCAPHSSRSPENAAARKPVVFSGKGSWDDRMEHVGRHLEKEDPGSEVEDLELRDWMVKERLVVKKHGRYVVAGLNGRRRSGRGNLKEEVAEGERDAEGEEDAEGEDE